MRLEVYRKAMPKYGRVLDLVTPHECSDEPVEFDLTPLDIPTIPPPGDNKFVKKLNELSPPPLPNLDRELRDRRPTEQVKSSAPESLIAHIKGLPHTAPTHTEIKEPKGN